MTDDAPQSGEIADVADTERPLLHLLRTVGRPHTPWLGLGVVGAAIASILDRADVFVIGLAFDAMFNGRAYSLPLLPDAVIPQDDPVAQLGFTVALLAAMKATDIAAAISGQIGTNVYAQRVLDSVRVGAFDAVQRLEMGFFDDHQTGEVMSVLNNDVNTLEEFLSQGLRFTVRVVLSFATALALMVLLNWQLAVFALVLTPVIAGMNHWFSAVRERLQDDVRAEMGALNARVETNLSGVDVVKTFTAEDYERDRVETTSDEHRAARWDARKLRAVHPPSMRLVSGVALVATFVVGAIWVIDEAPLFFSGELTAGQLIPFLFYIQSLTGPMKWIADLIGFHKRGKAAAKRIVGVQRTDRTREYDAGEDLEVVEGRVGYEDVRFSYPGSDETVLDGVTFAAEPGETVGIVGTTGAGKSTLIKLLLRYYDADAGRVTVDGRDVRDLSVTSLRSAIGYVDQDPFLFNGTIRENVAFADPDAADERVERAAREAGAHEFVTDLEDGYETEVGERGAKLSGGQRQRIAIARAILCDPEIMVFDEATSHVDNETEAMVQRRLDDLTADRTTLVIAHRLSTVRDADRILVVEDGRIVESGSHEELLERDGTYANLWAVQVGNVEALPDDFLADATGGEPIAED